MCRGRIQWWQSRTVSAAPVAGWTSSAGEGRSTASAGPFSQWTQCDCPTSGPEKLWCPGTRMSFEHIKLQVVKTAPDSQLLDLLSVSRLATVLDETDQCGVWKLQELDRGVFRCAVIGVQGEEQWGENTALRSSSVDQTGAGCIFSQPH